MSTTVFILIGIIIILICFIIILLTRIFFLHDLLDYIENENENLLQILLKSLDYDSSEYYFDEHGNLKIKQT